MSNILLKKNRSMITLGVTGGIGSGKSVVSKLLEIRGIPVYYTDTEAKRITNSSPLIKEKLVSRFGADLYRSGELDKQLLASIIFNDPDSLLLVNSIIHPEVRKDFVSWKESFTGCKYVAVESAILFDSGLGSLVDVSITVSAPLMDRVARVQKRDDLNSESVLNRINNQMSDLEREAQANYVIINDGIFPLIPQIENILKSLDSQYFV